MTFNFIPLFANGNLSQDDYALVVANLKRSGTAIRKIPEFRNLQNVDILIQANTQPPFIPIGGRAPNGYLIEITIDPNQSYHYKNHDCNSLSKTFAHELHHILRHRGVGYGSALGETLVSEGLAQVFELETGHAISPYSINLNKEELLDASKRARDVILNKKDYNYPHWFFGTEQIENVDERFKHWTGYSLGFAIVSCWLQHRNIPNNNTRITASNAVCKTADEILKPWLDKGHEFFAPWLDGALLPDHPTIKGTSCAIGLPKQRSPEPK